MGKLDKALFSWTILLTLAVSPGIANSQTSTPTTENFPLLLSQEVDSSNTVPRGKPLVYSVATRKSKAISSDSVSCSIDLTPIKFSADGEVDNVKYVWKGTLLLSEDTDVATGKPTLVFVENSTFNLITPVLRNLAKTIEGELNTAGKKAEGCQNSFNGASAWVSADLPPRLGAKAGMTKRTCTCVREGECAISDIASGEVKLTWRIDAQKSKNNRDILLPVVLEERSDSFQGGEVFEVLKKWGIVRLIDDVFKTRIIDTTRNLGNAAAITNLVGYLSIPKPPTAHKLDIVKWDKPNEVFDDELLRDTRDPNVIYPIGRLPLYSSVEPYALTIERKYAWIRGPGCYIARCIREFGMDGVHNGKCPDLRK